MFICIAFMLNVFASISINPRHLDSLKFRHLSARTDSLSHSPSHGFSRLWDTFPPRTREAAVMYPLPDISQPPKRRMFKPV